MHSFLTAAVLLLVLAISTNHVDARASGAPSVACGHMRPNHGNSNGVDPVPYTVTTDVGTSYNLSTTYTGNTSLLAHPPVGVYCTVGRCKPLIYLVKYFMDKIVLRLWVAP